MAILSFQRGSGATSVPFNSNVLTAFDASTMTLVLTSPTTMSFFSGSFSGSLTGTFQFSAGGDIVGGTISTFSMSYGEAYRFNFTDLNLLVVDFTNTLISQGAQAVYQQALAGDDKISMPWGSSLMTAFIEGFGGNDTINTGAGHDTVYGGAGNDVITNPHDGLAYGATTSYLRGDDGNDTIKGGHGFDDINGNKGDDRCMGGGGSDWVVGGQGNDVLYGDFDNIPAVTTADDIVYGNLGDDTCYGGVGADWVRGGQGADVLYGDDGNDWMAGDRGNDTVTGGAGADVFYGFAGIGLDRVTDFSIAQGDRIQLAPGTAYTLRQDGANAVVDLGLGDQIVLAGVEAASLTGNWIFFG